MFARSTRFPFFLTALCAGLGCVLPTSASATSLRTLGAQQTRLQTIAYRLASANADKCANPRMLSGLVIHDLSQYASAARPAVSSAFHLRAGIGVIGIVSNSVAQRAGLQIDDEIVALNGYSVEDEAAIVGRAPSADRIERFEQVLSTFQSRGPVDLTIHRQGQVVHASLSGQLGCGGTVSYSDSGEVNAWSDGGKIRLNRGIIEMAQDDDQIAFVMAHEMGHNILESAARGGDARRFVLASLTRLPYGGNARNEETQADLAAVALTRAAGYDPEAGVRFLGIAQRRMWWAISFDHPGFGSRQRTIASAIALANRTQQWAEYRERQTTAMAFNATAVPDIVQNGR